MNFSRSVYVENVFLMTSGRIASIHGFFNYPVPGVPTKELTRSFVVFLLLIIFTLNMKFNFFTVIFR